MKGLWITTDNKVTEREITKEALQSLYDGPYEIVHPNLTSSYVILVDGNGLSKGLAYNYEGSRLNCAYLPENHIVGDILILKEDVGMEGGELVGLDSSDIKILSRIFNIRVTPTNPFLLWCYSWANPARIVCLIMIVMTLALQVLVCRLSFWDSAVKTAKSEYTAYEELADYFAIQENLDNEGAIPLRDHAELEKVNPDYSGWLHIPGTQVDYPVVSTYDTEFYRHHNFYRDPASVGTPHMYDSDSGRQQRNVAIILNPLPSAVFLSDLFSTGEPALFSLEEYYSSSYLYKHQSLYYATKTSMDEYRVFSTFYVSDDSFAYNKSQFETDDEFRIFIDDCKSRSLREIYSDISDDAQILTLSMDGTDHGTFVVMSVRV